MSNKSFWPWGKWPTILIVIGGFASLTIPLYYMNQVRSQSNPSPSPIVTKPPIKFVTALGRLEPKGEVVKLSAPNSAFQGVRVDKLLVKLGDPILKDQVIAVLDNRDRLQAALNRAKQEVKVQQANLAKVKAGSKQGEISAQKANVSRMWAQKQGEIDAQREIIARLLAEMKGKTIAQQATINRLKAELENASIECDRFESLVEEGAVTKSARDQRCLARATALEHVNEAQAELTRIKITIKAQIDEAQATLNRIKQTGQEQIKEAQGTLSQIEEVRPVDVMVAQAELDRAIASMIQAQTDYDLAFVRSPIAGTVLKVNSKPGEVVGTDGIIELGQTQQMMVVAEIYESDIKSVKLGQLAIITSESQAFTGEINGRVEEIGVLIGKKNILNTDPAAAVDSRVVEVKIKLDEASSRKVSKLTYSKVVTKIKL